MRRVGNISGEAIQRHTIVFEQSKISLTLRFYPRVQIWAFDAEYRDRAIYGAKLSVGVLHMESRNLPFDFIVTDESGNGLDPFRLDDFEQGRCRLYLLEPEDMLRVRNNAEVPL